MSINEHEDLGNSSFKPDESSYKYPLHKNSESLDMIAKLANEMYREDLAPVLMEQFVDARNDTEHIYPKAPAQGGKLSTAPRVPGDLYRKGTQTFINRQIQQQGDISALNTGLSGDSSYYFMPGFKSVTASGQNNSLYYRPGLDVHSIRKDFPILQRRINGKPLVWLDNAATTQKPLCVINSLNRFYSEYNSNIHRGAHTLAKLATNAYESAREKVRDFIGAASTEEIIFVRGATEAINLVSDSFGGMKISSGDEIVLTMMEHHSNIVPWQKLQQTKGAVIKVIPINDRGEVILEEYERLFSPRTRIVAITHVSNVLGTINPLRVMIETAHKHGAHVLIDGAQAVPHTRVDVSELDADFYVFSGHKVYGPTGIGVLYGKKALLEEMQPWQRGGGMIKHVSFNETTYNGLPYKFEAGTGNIADAVGLGAAIDYIGGIGMENIERHEKELTAYAIERLYQIPGLHLIGTAREKTSVIAFILEGISSDNVAQRLNQEGIAVRAGHHCAQPALMRFGLTGSVRASLGVYNMKEEVDALAESVLKIARKYS